MISAIIPARNEEASIARAVESIAAQPEIDEVIVVNDQSTDRTAAILSGLATTIPKLQILSSGGLPDGWTGKNHAVSLGAAAAHAEWLLFTDADTYHYLGSARRALNDAAAQNAVLVSYSPEQEMETWWERTMIPFVYCKLSEKFSYDRVNDPTQVDAAANGQFLMIRRSVYDQIGGHEAVAGNLLEDVALAEIAKNHGHRIYFVPSALVHTRMYRTFRDMWQGWTKNLYLMFPQDIESKDLVAGFVLMILCIAGAFVESIRAHAAAFVDALILTWMLWLHAAYAVTLRRNHFSARLILYFVPGSLLFAAARAVSHWKNTRGKVVWKGREYRAKAGA